MVSATYISIPSDLKTVPAATSHWKTASYFCVELPSNAVNKEERGYRFANALLGKVSPVGVSENAAPLMAGIGSSDVKTSLFASGGGLLELTSSFMQRF